MKKFTKHAVMAIGMGLAISAIAVSSTPQKAQEVNLEPITPPFLEDFSDGVEGLEKNMVVVDANGDGKTWTVMGMQARIQYNSKMDMDDWMITRGLNLEAGKAYKFSIDGCNSNAATYVEEFEVKLGSERTVEAMTQTVLPVSKINSKTNINFSSIFYVEKSGVYYLGIHGCSPKNKRTMYLDNISVSAPMDGNLPSGVSDAKAVPSPDGKYKATVSFKAPSLNVLGKELTEVTKIEVVRDDTVAVKTFTNVVPGSTQEVVDEFAKAGSHTWKITPYTAAGVGESVTVSTYVGYGKPQPVSNVKVVEKGNTGEVTITWTAPEKDLNGLTLTPEAVTYKIQDVSGSSPVVLEEAFKGNSYTYKATEAGEQAFKSYQINAITEGGNSSAVFTADKAVGTPDNLIYFESFANSALSHLVLRETAYGVGAWSLCTSAMHPAQDGDNGLMLMQAKNLRDAARLTTAKINLGDAANPIMTFYTYNFAQDGDNVNELKVEVFTPDTTAVLLNKTIKDLSTVDNDWNKIEVSLSEFKGKTIQLAITATAMKYAATFIDALTVLDKVDNNLTMFSSSAPKKVKTGVPFDVTVLVKNNGVKKATGYDLELYRNGEKIRTIAGREIASEKVDTVAFKDSLTVLDKADMKYSVKINMATDSHPEDNASVEMAVTHQLPSFPVPTSFAGAINSNGMPELSWVAPVTEGVTLDPVTDDFESYDAWSNKTAGDWTFIDMDKGNIGGCGNYIFPGIDRDSQQSFFVLKSDMPDFNLSVASHSGVQCLSNMFIKTGDKKVDDWLISPRLSGHAQKVTFWAKSYTQAEAETFEILYSKTGKDTKDFVLIETKEKVVNKWTEYSFDLPEGAEYFAIRCISVDKYMLMLDDFTYTPAGFANLTLKGYNLYRDGVKANASPITDTKYVDNDATVGTHNYRLTAVYEEGESRAIEEIALGYSSVAGVDVAAGKVYGTTGVIVFEALSGNAVVSDMSGKVIYNGEVPANGSISAEPGIYIVVVEDKTVKTVVR